MIRLYRKVIRITAEDSPNVALALEQVRQGQAPIGEVVTPGVLTYDEYRKRLATWDEQAKCVGLSAQFYQGPEILLYPPAWLALAVQLAANLKGKPRKALAIGIDPAEGGDSTCMSAVDDLGLIEQVSKKTPDTSVIRGEALAFMRRHNVLPQKVCIDRGGGGKQIADDLRADGHPVRTVAFGESVAMEPKHGKVLVSERREAREERYAYVNRRAEMAGELSLLLDPARPGHGFAIPAEHAELLRQMRLIPKLYDREGRLRVLPKSKVGADSREKTLVQLIGHSPDEFDSLCLAVYAMTSKPIRMTAGGA